MNTLAFLKRNRNYRLLYSGQFISFIGTMITMVALPYQIYAQTKSTLMVGLLSLCQLMPLLITALLGGVLADRYHRRKLLLISEMLLAGGCILLASNALLPVPKVWLIFVVATLMSAITGLHRPALDGIMQQIVAKKDFPIVTSLSTFIYSIGMIIGPAIGGVIIQKFGIVTTFFVDFISFLISLIVLIQIKGMPKPTVTKVESVFASLLDGFRYTLSKQELVGTYLVDFAAMIFGMPMALFPAIAQSYGGDVLGLLYAAPAAGAMLVSIFNGWTTRIKRHGLAISVAACLWGVAIICFGFATHAHIVFALFFLALAGAFDALSGIFRMVMWNDTIPNEFRGRLAGISMIGYLSGPKLGDTEAGVVAALFGVTTSIISGGILCVVSVAVCCYFLPKFWRYQPDQNSIQLKAEA